MKLAELGFNALIIDAQAVPLLRKQDFMKAIDEFSLQGKIYVFGEDAELNQISERSGGKSLIGHNILSGTRDLTTQLRHSKETILGLSELTGIKPSLLRTHVLHIKYTNKRVLSDMPSFYGYSFEEYKSKKDCFLRLIAHGFENCIHACTYCYANYTYDRPTTLLINSPGILKSNIKEAPFRELIQQGFVVNIGSVTDLCSEVSLYFGILQDFLDMLNGINTVLVTKCPSFARDDILECLKKHSRTKITFTFTDLPQYELNLPYDSRHFPMQQISKAIVSGLDVSLLYRPVIPGQNDTKDQILAILQKAKIAGIKNVSMGFIRINDRMHKSISTAFPNQTQYMFEQVSDKFDEDLYPKLEYRLKIARIFRDICSQLNLNLSFCQGYLGEHKDSYANYYCLCQKERWSL